MTPIDVTSVQLGAHYRDTVTGFEGIATCRSEYLNGCVQACIETGVNGEPKSSWVDYDRLELVELKGRRAVRGTGGPQPTPPGPAHP